jgi:hypothetical protein
MWRKAASLFAAGIAVPVVALTTLGGSSVAASGTSGTTHPHIDCSNPHFICTELYDSYKAFDTYVGHDEPSLLFYSNKPGSGNEMQYEGTLPVEPSPTNVPGKHTYSFELTPAYWFGMIMCDTQSYPELVNTCIPDSDANIVNPKSSPYHPGAAYMEFQLYPPGYVEQWDGFSCSPTKWCAALTIDSYALNPLTGQELNASCANRTGIEYVNFAFLTRNGKPLGPPNPVQFNPNTSGNPNNPETLFLNQGDSFRLTMHDTSSGFNVSLNDVTTGQTGSMTASAANGFGQVKFAPSPSTECENIPYNFHPMYSTSTPQTTVPWAAATYNVAIDTEIGHFQYCSHVDASTGQCTGYEGVGSNREPADGDDYACFPPSASSLIKIGGCEYSNLGYDGPSYQNDWPDGSSSRPSPIIFTAPLTGSSYNTNYSSVAFNTDLPTEEAQFLGTCNQDTGRGCTIIPPTDDGTPANFYPYYTTVNALGGCAWTVGGWVPGVSIDSFGGHSQFGTLQKVYYTQPNGYGEPYYSDYNNALSNNPCPR